MFKITLISMLVLITNTLIGQALDYVKISHDSTINFFAIADEVQHYYDSLNLDTVKGSGYKQFARWVKYWSPRTGQVGNNPYSLIPSYQSFASLLSMANICNGGAYNESWSFIGHNFTRADDGPSKGQGVLKVVHVDMIHDPTGNTIYVGAPNSGLWRTTNAKASNPEWVCLTDSRFPGMGVSGIAIDPNDEDVIYIATGFGLDDIPSYGMGVLKTTNGSSANPTWNATGLTYDINNPTKIVQSQGVYISPSNSNIIFAFNRNELWKSTNGGNNFNLVLSDYTQTGSPSVDAYFFNDLEFLPADPSTIFVSFTDNNLGNGGAQVFKSSNNGVNWTNITSSLNFQNLKQRIDLAVTPANQNFIAAAGGSFYSYEFSTSKNQGVLWHSRKSTLEKTIYMTSSQGYWMNDIEISRFDTSNIYYGNMVQYKSTDGGTKFSKLYDYGVLVHADTRDIQIFGDGAGNDILYSANDGGLNVSYNNGTNWTNLNGTNLNITQIYGIDFNPNKDWITIGCQDLGYYTTIDGNWDNYSVGDGGRIIFNHYEFIETMYGVNSSPKLLISIDKGANWYDTLGSRISVNKWPIRDLAIDGFGFFYTQDGKKLYRKSKNNWFKLIQNFNDLNGTEIGANIKAIGTNKTDSNTLYVGFDFKEYSAPAKERLFKTNNAFDANPTWTDISAGLPFSKTAVSDLVVDPQNPDHFWVIMGWGFDVPDETNRIYFSSDGGSTYTGINDGLLIDGVNSHRFPINVGVLDEATGGMYLGTDIGVYYNPNPKDPNSSWECFNRDLPVCIVTDLKIDYCNRKILASTFGRGLWESDLAENPSKNIVLTSADLLNIPHGEVRLFYSDVTVPTGYNMTVKGTLKMAPDRTLTIEPGAKLVVEGGTITSTCSRPFAGIRVEGNVALNQIWPNQGVVILNNNATIENAHIGISLIGIKSNGDINWNSRGGFVNANNSIFRNNQRDVEFMSYHPKASNGQEVNNKSYFKNCTFTTNNDINFTGLLKEHVTMWDVNGVRFIGCTFKEERTAMTPSNARVGIYTINANFTINERCLNFPSCTNIDPTEFDGLQQAVMSFGNGSKGLIKIENCQIKCYKGVYLNGTFQSQVRKNNFDVKHISVLGGSTFYPYGLYLDVCDKFNTEGNHFNGLGNTSLEGAAGLVIRNAGETFNEFYRSDFNDIRVGSQAQGLNRDDNDLLGLIFRCNDYVDGYNDLDVRHENMVWYLYAGMAERQGVPGVWYPDNEFGNTSPILNLNAENTVSRIEYLYEPPALQTNTFYPYQVTNSTFYRLGISHPEYCPNRIGTYGTNFEPLTNGMMNAKPLLVEKKEDETELTDGGNTDHFLTIIDGATSTNKNTVFNELNAASPYLSNRVLSELAQKEGPFTQEQIRDLLIANPHASRNTYVMQLLNNRSDNFPSAYFTSIEGEIETYTYRDTLLTELAALEYEYNGYLTEYLAGKMTDSTTTVGQLHSFMKHPTQPTYHYHLADMYFAQGKFTEFNQVKDSIAQVFALDERQQAFHDNYSQLHSVMQYWHATDSVLHHADTGRYSYLLNFDNNYDVLPPVYYAMMAVNDSFVLNHDVFIPETGSEPFDENTNLAEALEAENTSSALNLFPNPANDAFTLEWKTEFKQARVLVHDATGRLVWQKNWQKNSSLTINTSAWESGNYLINVETQSGETHQRKLLINK